MTTFEHTTGSQAPNYELLHTPDFMQQLMDPEQGAVIMETVLGVMQELAVHGPTEDTLAASGLNWYLEQERRKDEKGAASQILEQVELVGELFKEVGDVESIQPLLEEPAGLFLNLLISQSNLDATSSYATEKRALIDRLEREQREKRIITLTKESASWLKMEAGDQIEVELSRQKTPGGRSFLWTNIIPNSNKTLDLFEAIDPSKRQYVVSAVLEKISGAVDTGNKATMPQSSNAGLGYEGKFKSTIFPVWKARNIEGSEYRGFVLRAEDTTLEDDEVVPVFLVAIACNHSEQNGNHSPVYKGILGGAA